MSPERPDMYTPLDDDEMETDLGPPGSSGGYPPPAWGGEEADPTELSPSQRGLADLDEMDHTELGRASQIIDETELDFDKMEAGPYAILWVKEGPRRGATIKIKDGSTIGRRDTDVILDDPKVSNPHAKIRLENEEYVLWDFGSKNGTYVNGEQIRAATTLKENDEIKIGETTFLLKVMI